MPTSRKRAAGALHLLTTRQVQHAPDGDHSDGGGLTLRIRGESASWVFRFTSPAGRRREMGLGACHRGSTAQAGGSLTGARDHAHRVREQVRQGIDPIDARNARREADREAENRRLQGRDREHWTLKRWARAYHERVIEPTKTSKHGADWIASLENHVPARIWGKPIGEITPPELLEALLEVRPHERARRITSERLHETQRRIRQRLEAVFADAVFHGKCTSNPAAAIKRKLAEAMPPEKSGSMRALPYREAPALMARLRGQEGIAARCLELAILTAARTGEVLGAVWSELDLESAVWTIPSSRVKGGEVHVVYLPPRAVELLQSIKSLGLNGHVVFPSPMDLRKPLSNMAMLKVLQRLGLRHKTTVHGVCRSTFSTWANEVGAARPDVIEACLAHSEQDRVRAAYNRASFNDDRRALLVAWATFLGTPPAEVLTFERAA